MLEVPFTTIAMLLVAVCLRCLALLLGIKPCASMTAWMRALVSALTSGWSLSARETVLTAYPDSLAMSLIVTSPASLHTSFRWFLFYPFTAPATTPLMIYFWQMR